MHSRMDLMTYSIESGRAAFQSEMQWVSTAFFFTAWIIRNNIIQLGKMKRLAILMAHDFDKIRYNWSFEKIARISVSSHLIFGARAFQLKRSMSIMRKLVASFVFGILWMLVGYFGWSIYQRQHYLAAFAATQNGDSLKTVLDRFGIPSHIEPKSDSVGYDSGSRSVCGESCSLRLWYELPFSLGITPVTVDFNTEQRVIHKYEWSSP